MRRCDRLLFSLVLVTALAAPLPGEGPSATPDLARQKTELAKLAWMVGSWEGDAWVQRGSMRTEVKQKETISTRLDGLSLLIEGEGRSKADPAIVVFRALGVLYFDHYAQGFRLASWTGEGYSAVSPANLTADGFTWELTTPGGRVRYVASHAAGTWSEIGEWSVDGKAWSKFFEMTLKKTG